MKQVTWTVVLVAGAVGGVGCQAPRYSSQPLGAVSYAEAFQAGRAAFAQHFTVESSDPAGGTITGRPKPIDAGRDRLFGVSPARQVATMRITERGGQVYADVRVNVQRQDVGALRQMQPVTVDNELPNRTPAQETAAISADQDQAWQTTGRDEALERAVLEAVVDRLAKKK